MALLPDVARNKRPCLRPTGNQMPVDAEIQPVAASERQLPTAMSPQRTLAAPLRRKRVDLDMRFLKLPEVRSRIPISRSQLYRMVAAGQFPKPHDLGARAVAWLESDIDAWIESRIAASKNAEVSRG